MTTKQKRVLLATLFVICGVIVFYQYNSQKEKHERLETIGQITSIVATHSERWGVDYANYYFIASNGQRIEGSEKCPNGFERYKSELVIYNPTNPHEYDLWHNYLQYYPTWRIIFFFFIYLPIMIFVIYRFIYFAATLYLKFKKGL